MSLTSDIKETYRYNMDGKLKKLCDSHDNLERKLKIAEDALLVVSDQVECCCHEVEELPDEGLVCGECLIRKALKQIRGSND